MGSSESKLIEPRLHASSLSKANFPTSFNLYYESMRRGLKFVIGEHKDQPTHIISVPNGWCSDMVLYSGPTVDTDPLAVTKYGNKMGTVDAVLLPPKKPGEIIRREEIRTRLNKMDYAYTFAVEVGSSGYPEKFEWRSSKTEEIKELGGLSRGCKLVRLNQGEEVVAVWTHAKWSLSKGASFRFTGSGATGELGPMFMTMAVVSFVRQYQAAISNSVTASTATGASVAVAC